VTDITNYSGEKIMFKRYIKPLLAKALKRSPVVLLNGARQIGKTTLALEFMKERKYTYLTFDDEITYLAAKSNSTDFLSKIDKPVIIDEVQRVPEIFLAIKRDVDNNRVAGRYLLTGSANPLLIPRLGDSLAGRMEVINLMPLSQGEIYNTEEQFIDIVFGNKQLKSPKKSLTKKTLYKRILGGGYPSVQEDNEEDRSVWMRNYLNLILQRDIKDLAQIEKITELPNLLKILAARASNLLNVAEVARDSKIPEKTLHRYIALLETIFIVNLKQTWSNNLTLRITKAPKIYLVDSGLLAYLLDFSIEKLLEGSSQTGKIMENFIMTELQKQSTWSKKEVQMYHFRSSGGEEVDIVLEDRSGNIVGIEIKNSATVNPADFKGLRYLREKAKDKFVKGIIFYTGSQYIPFEKDLFALPVNALWEDITD
jgi:predicted AAA+ superfamily ATPase